MLKSFLFICLFRLISCEKSFTIVLDTTSSMQEEIDIIKLNLAAAINGLNNTDVSDYIIVPFNDPDVGEPVISRTPKDLVSSLNAFTASGGHKCPENSLAGIERALQISKPTSNIFLFTDAYSKDANKLGSVQSLCRNTRSQVVIFLTGYCLPSPDANVQVYYDVARACSGAVLRLDPATLRQAFGFISEVISVQWTDIINYDTFTNYKQLSFSVDSFTKTVLLEVSGESPILEVTTPDGSSRTIEKILDFRHTQVIRLTSPAAGEHLVHIRCQGITSVTMYRKYELPLRFGFSTKLPRSMRETSSRPMPGRINYILIDVSQGKMKLEKVEIQFINEQDRTVLSLEEHHSSGFYWSQVFVGLDKPFRIWIKGYDTSSYQEIKGSSEVLIPQQTDNVDTRWTKPMSEILDSEPITVDFGTNATAACKVTGYPAPSISWRDKNGVSLPSEEVLIEIPSLYISYVSLENVDANATISCMAKNSEGEDAQSLRLYVHRPFIFEVVQTPTDQTIEYGSDGKLYCEVTAYPPAAIKWYHNDTEVIFADGIEILPESNALWIKNMTVDTVGDYKCEMMNEANDKSYNAFVNISGIEAPQVEAEKADVVLKLGDWSSLECRLIKGKPSPTISWTYKTEDGYEFGTLPEGVEADFDKLKISSAQSHHKGVYRCNAENIMGQHSTDITVQLQFPPTIRSDGNNTVIVKEDDDVALPCDVEASPAARVRWEMSQDDVLIALDDRHHTDRRNTHRFKALLKDSGNYHCIAENDVGTAEKTITVNVLVPPYIQAPKTTTMTARVGDNVILPCNVLYGNPVPTTKWKFIALDSTTRVLSKHNSSRPLHLTNVGYSNVGSYLCIAENLVDTDYIQIHLKIQ